MIKELKIKEARIEGNSLLFSTYPVVGVVGLTSFLDDVDGVDANHKFEKSFRYSTNGIDYSEWVELTLINLQALNFPSNQVVSFELQYFKNQPPGEDVLKVNQVTIQYNHQNQPPQEIFDKTIFHSFFETDDIAVLNWYINVLNKLYDKGLIANYIDRRNHNGSSIDFIQLWSSIAKFFAYYVVYARQFQNFHQSDVLLFEFLEQRGINISSTTTLEEMNKIMSNFYQEMSKRGTIRIVDRKEDGEEIEGELLRLLNYDEAEDELLFNPRLPHHAGWNLGSSSPLHRGLFMHRNVDKVVQRDIREYLPRKFTFTKKIKIDSRLNYSFFFLIKTNGLLSVKLLSYDKNSILIPTYSYKTDQPQSFFFEDAPLYRSDVYLPITVHLYNCQKKTDANNTTSIHQGQDLKIHQDAVWVNFEITSTEDMIIEDVRFTPSQTPYSAGFLQIDNVIDLFAVNNNHKHTFASVCRYITKNLIPYNSNLLTTDLKDLKNIDTSVEEEVRETVWIGGDFYCEKLGWRPVNPSCETIETIWVGDEDTAYCKKIIV